MNEVEDLLYESGVEPKFADIIIQKIKTTKIARVVLFLSTKNSIIAVFC